MLKNEIRRKVTMDQDRHRDSRYAAAFATLICAWALLLVALSLATPLRVPAPAHAPTSVVAADAR